MPLIIMLSLLIKISISIECDKSWFRGNINSFFSLPFNYAYSTGDIPSGRWTSYVTVYQRINNEAIEYSCGGTVLSDKHILTSRLCAIDENGSLLNASDLLVRLGTHRQNVLNFGFAQFRAISRIHQPSASELAHENSIVLLEVIVPIVFNKLVQTGCLRTAYLTSNRHEAVVGWGIEGNNGALQIVVMDPNNCSTSFYDVTKFCSNDRGSTVYENQSEKWFIKGILNCSKPFSSISCTNNSKSIIEIAQYMPWIAKITDLNYLKVKRRGRIFNQNQKYPNLLPQRNCGNLLIDHASDGEYAALFEYAWIARIGHRMNYIVSYIINISTGTLISHRYILSTAFFNWLLGKPYVENYSRGKH